MQGSQHPGSQQARQAESAARFFLAMGETCAEMPETCALAHCREEFLGRGLLLKIVGKAGGLGDQLGVEHGGAEARFHFIVGEAGPGAAASGGGAPGSRGHWGWPHRDGEERDEAAWVETPPHPHLSLHRGLGIIPDVEAIQGHKTRRRPPAGVEKSSRHQRHDRGCLPTWWWTSC